MIYTYDFLLFHKENSKVFFFSKFYSTITMFAHSMKHCKIKNMDGHYHSTLKNIIYQYPICDIYELIYQKTMIIHTVDSTVVNRTGYRLDLIKKL